MKNVRILDCTLRDGGRILNCKFEDRTIRGITGRLSNAGIDIVEIGFLRDDKLVSYEGDSTFFTSVMQMTDFIPQNDKKTLYVAFADYKMYDFDKLERCDGSSITGIRVGFTKKQFDMEWEQIQTALQTVKEKGYFLFVQGVNSLAYKDRELLELIERINKVKPYSFGIVDTYGSMYLDDLRHYYNLVNYNLDEDICIDVHSHNNFQSSFAFAQEVITLANGERNIILDATLDGMGKCAGNLNTELIADYLIRKEEKDYDLDQILDIIDIYLLPIKNKYTWGYSIPAFMAGIYKSHPNNVIYLTEKYRLKSKDIRHILFGIDDQLRQTYDYDNIQRIYKKYSQNYVDDSEGIRKLQRIMEGKTAVVLAPGKSLIDYRERILEYIQSEDASVVSVNFIPDFLPCDFYFFTNTLYWEKACEEVDLKKCIVTSNIHAGQNGIIPINYISLIADWGKLFDNSTIMLLNLLKKVMVKKIGIAGFDGLTENHKNYVNEGFPDFANELTIEESNKEVGKLYKEFRNKAKGKLKVELLTPSIYERKERV